jgi:hypothetical protein
MTIARRDDTLQNTLGQCISGAQCYFLLQPADTNALTPLANVYSDTAGTVAANPQISDGFGHVVAYLTVGPLYTVVYKYPNGFQEVYPDQLVGGGSGGGGGGISPFAAIPDGTIDGTNQTFTIPQVLVQWTVWNNYPLVPGVGFTITVGAPGMIIIYAVAPQPPSDGNPGDSLYVQGF